MKKIKISMILPNFNSGKYLKKAINSFIAQTYSNKELIIVDGMSDDGSHEIIQEFVDNYDYITWLKKADKGLSEATNNGIDVCTGDIVGYMGGDDILYKDIFEEIIFLSETIDFDAIFFNSYTYYVKEKKCILRKPPTADLTKNSLIEHGTIVGLQNIFFKRHIYDKYRYNDNNKYCLDYDFYLNIAEENYLSLYVDKVASINIFDGNISHIRAQEQSIESFNIARQYCKTPEELNLLYTKSPFRPKFMKKEKRILKNLFSSIRGKK